MPASKPSHVPANLVPRLLSITDHPMPCTWASCARCRPLHPQQCGTCRGAHVGYAPDGAPIFLHKPWCLAGMTALAGEGAS